MQVHFSRDLGGALFHPCDLSWAVATSEERLRALEAAVREEPEDALGHYMLGLEYHRLARLDDAANAFRRAVERNPDYTAAYRELGKTLRDAGHRQEAIRVLETGLAVAAKTKDLQTAKEMEVFLRRLRGSRSRA